MNHPAPDAPPQLAQPVVLVVEDALDTLDMLCEALAAEGYDVLVARDVDEALARLAVAAPDGVLLDAMLPGRDGFSLCAQIKQTPAWAHVPVLFMTGLSETDQIIKGFACGGVDYVVKPLRLPEVMARLATHVRNARVAPTNPLIRPRLRRHARPRSHPGRGRPRRTGHRAGRSR